MLLAPAVALWFAFAPAADPNAQCLACHGEKGFQSESGRSVYVDADKFKSSSHAFLNCTACHAGVKDYPHPKDLPKADCATCHAEVVRGYGTSVHAAARTNGDPGSPTCQSCHGEAHAIRPKSDPASPAAKKNLPDTCGACHANPEFLARHRIPFARPVEAYRLSVHGRAVARGSQAAPSCSDCHASHAIFPARDPRARINHWHVAETCGACHTEIKNTYVQSVHGQAAQRGARDAPVCTDCHGEHAILAPSEPQSLVNPARVSSVTCGRCHADERLAQRYNLPTDKVPAFEDSYHGLALRAGSQTVANCASCHGVHNILPSADLRSTVHPANLAKTCGTCHPGAGKRFAIGPVHVRAASATEHPVVRWVRVTYWIIIPLTVAFMLLHNALDFFAKLIRARARVHSGEKVPRMNLHFRIAHWLVVLSFPTLVVTGFALKFPDAWWAAPFLQWESQLAFRGLVHRIAGVILVVSLVYHFVHVIVSKRDRVILRELRPGKRDLTDIWTMGRYNLGITAEPPSFAKFSYAEKFEYWAFVWGTLVMTATGFLLWFNNFTLRNFPKWVSDAATAVHYYEAVLATLSILVWHFYLVIYDPDVYPMDLTWLTGRASADHFRATRPQYYLSLAAEQAVETESKRDGADPTGAETGLAQDAAEGSGGKNAQQEETQLSPPKAGKG